ncbi:MAG: hypothetical protein AVDCRST_MAG70-2498 [uncultured Thermomicrobiales bacterium]|uniref:Uncharacterized protein n=1 Tax=uncultured Thermomicrobiales bacterium TaxID=1645740 RepID=A0A6J4VAQ5_9BACT|nr:MAG: hypothetical protein AVDCRST_MAG70-2498 [uncultured Thermomicrobiales bacterium]
MHSPEGCATSSPPTVTKVPERGGTAGSNEVTESHYHDANLAG